eukprot:GHVU01040995.1.p1 GENE.GHVU01040995.1~~GHVU01040995.1.p1  ORF type:complete len:174 (+),score=13.05 GHVU01040995.1:829-1350(+)
MPPLLTLSVTVAMATVHRSTPGTFGNGPTARAASWLALLVSLTLWVVALAIMVNSLFFFIKMGRVRSVLSVLSWSDALEAEGWKRPGAADLCGGAGRRDPTAGGSGLPPVQDKGEGLRLCGLLEHQFYRGGRHASNRATDVHKPEPLSRLHQSRDPRQRCASVRVHMRVCVLA